MKKLSGGKLLKEILFGVAGGLSIFIFGMNLMSEGLKKSAGERLRIILETITKNPFIGVIVGALVTAIIQSSSATTIMAVSFVNARLMTLPQAIGIIMGANIGTTITAQLIAFKIGSYAYAIAAIGFILFFFVKRKNWQYIGQVIFGFGLLFIGLNTMSNVLTPLAQSELFADWLVNLGENPILAVGIGTLMTVIIQSSSATIGVLQTLASQPVNINGVIQPLIPLSSAIPVLLGDNIGTTITAIFASIGTNKGAKRAAAAHSLFNVFGCLIFLILMPVFLKFVLWFSPQLGPGMTRADIIPRQIANAHLSFNLLNTIIWIPFTGLLARMVTRFIPGEDPYVEKGAKYLNQRITDNPSVALELSANELVRMGHFASEMFDLVKNAFQSGDLSNEQQVQDFEDNLDILQKDIIHYLSAVVSHSTLSKTEAARLADLMHVVGDIERIGDHCMNIFELAAYKQSSNIKISDEAVEELENIFHLSSEMISHSLIALKDTDFKAARKILGFEEQMDAMEENLRLSHISRLNQGTCNPNSAVCFVDLLKNLERMADHCYNIAEAVLDSEKQYEW